MNVCEIKTALNERAEEFARWLFPSGKKNGHEWTIGSLRGEQGSSLSVCIEGSKVGIFCDFATGDKGDNLVELCAQAQFVAFKDALRTCGDWLGVPLTRSQTTSPISSKRHYDRLPFPADGDLLSVEQCREALSMIETLASDVGLCERIAQARGWKVETIKGLTREPSLGWHDGKLVFVYETGVKFRWRENGERIIRWAFGKPWIWRGCFLANAKTVYLCEGETDAISLIDAGLEQRPDTFAVALPSASTFDAGWAEAFRDKDVVLVLDADAAGANATAKISRLLALCARSLKQLNWGEVRYASAS